MRHVILTYGTMALSSLIGGVALFYVATPDRDVKAPDVIEIVEGTLERCATLSWNITAITNDGGWGYYSTTNVGTNYNFMGLLWGEGGAVVSPGYPGIPVVGASASRDLLIRTLKIIEHLPTKFVQSFTETNVTYWTATGLWEHCSVGGGVYSNWTIAITNGYPQYGPATNLSVQVQTAVLWEAYRLLKEMTITAHEPDFVETNAFYGTIDDDIYWYDEGGAGPTNDNTHLPVELYSILHGLDSNGVVLSELFIELPEPSNYQPSDGSPPQRNNNLDRRAAYYWASVNPYMSGYGYAFPAYPPYTWVASAKGSFPCERRAQRSAGYISVPIADLGAGVTAVTSVTYFQTGLVVRQTGESYSGRSYVTNTVINHYTTAWTNVCSGTLTGMIQAVKPDIIPSLWTFFDYIEFPVAVQAFIPPGNYPYGDTIQEYGAYPGSQQQLLEADMWYEFKRWAVVEWQFRYCR